MVGRSWRYCPDHDHSVSSGIWPVVDEVLPLVGDRRNWRDQQGVIYKSMRQLNESMIQSSAEEEMTRTEERDDAHSLTDAASLLPLAAIASCIRPAPMLISVSYLCGILL